METLFPSFLSSNEIQSEWPLEIFTQNSPPHSPVSTFVSLPSSSPLPTLLPSSLYPPLHSHLPHKQLESILPQSIHLEKLLVPIPSYRRLNLLERVLRRRGGRRESGCEGSRGMNVILRKLEKYLRSHPTQLVTVEKREREKRAPVSINNIFP